MKPETPVNAEYIERCQLEFARNPRSRVFAPLAEAYRKMGLLDEAIRTCEAGLAQHPDFAGGHVVYAKCLIDRRQHAEALAQLEKAAGASPDNLMAHALMGETLLELRRPKDALRAFKMALFLNPQDERARQAVRKWEFLTAEEYDDDLFVAENTADAMALAHPTAGPPVSEQADRIARNPPPRETPLLERELERALSLADAFTVRNNLESAMQVLRTARERLGPLAEIDNRLNLLVRRTQMLEEEPAQPIRPLGQQMKPTPPPGAKPAFPPSMAATAPVARDAARDTAPAAERKTALLQSLLTRIRDRQSDAT